MKVKEFISWIRPITALDPDSEVIISHLKDDLDIEKIIISEEVTFISLERHLPKSDK